MTFIDWFAGIGGFRRGLELAGHKCVGFCEFDKYAVMSYTSMHLITDEQREYLAKLPLKERQKEILREEYRNGEWFANDVRRVYAEDIPRADMWCFGFPCQDISISGKQRGFYGNRSSLFFRVMYLIGQLKEEDKPDVLFIENVKNLLSVNGGWDFARLLSEVDKGGYDAEWQVLNSKYFGVPQNRERCFIIGYLRGSGRRNIFPIEQCNATKQGYIHCIEGGVLDLSFPDSNTRRGRVIDEGRICPTLNTGCEIGVIQVAQIYGTEKEPNPQAGRVYSSEGISPCLDSMRGGNRQPKIIVKPCITPDRAEKRQNGRRFKNDGEEMFTLTAQDKHDVLLDDGNEVMIRRLTPKECFRLQGWTDDYFERAQFVNSDSQLYKQAGNGVTVNVIQSIGEKLDI